MADFIIIVLALALVAVFIVSAVKKSRGKSCCGKCEACKGCSSASKQKDGD